MFYVEVENYGIILEKTLFSSHYLSVGYRVVIFLAIAKKLQAKKTLRFNSVADFKAAYIIITMICKSEFQ